MRGGIGKNLVGWVVAIDNAVASFLEELGLGSDIAGESFVIIKMLVGNISHDGNFDWNAEDAELGKGVGSGF